MQIIDADVDANLFDYDMSEDLSMRIEPYIINSTYIESDFSSTLGLRCSIKF
jgi:hypothetical protein